MAVETEKKTAANGNITTNALVGGTAFIGYRAGPAYNAFARIKVAGNTGGANVSFLVAGVGRLATNSNGLFFVQVRFANGTVAHMRVNTLVESAGVNNTPTFGWWKDGDYVYIGVYHPNTTLSSFTATMLGYNPESAFDMRTGSFYNSSTAPTGWTAATIS